MQYGVGGSYREGPDLSVTVQIPGGQGGAEAALEVVSGPGN